MGRTTNYREFMALEPPESAEELEELALCVAGPEEFSRYRSYADNVQSLVIVGSGEIELVLSQEGQKAAFRRYLEGWTSEEGATFHGEAVFEKAMKKKD